MRESSPAESVAIIEADLQLLPVPRVQHSAHDKMDDPILCPVTLLGATLGQKGRCVSQCARTVTNTFWLPQRHKVGPGLVGRPSVAKLVDQQISAC